MTTQRTTAAELTADRLVAEELQDRLRRDQQTATALRAYLLDRCATEKRRRARSSRLSDS